MTNPYEQRPDGPAPGGHRQEPLDVVFVTSLDGKLYELPTAVAAKYEVTEARARELGDIPIKPEQEDDDEVGGRHRMLLPDGTTRYHANWVSGAYVWHRDYRSYSGPHWHRDPNSPLGYNMQDY